jgi:hypothetical protein
LGAAPAPKRRRVAARRDDAVAEAEIDEWGPVIARLTALGVDPTGFGDLTFPLMLAILTGGQADRPDEGARARQILRDFKLGKYRDPTPDQPG